MWTMNAKHRIGLINRFVQQSLPNNGYAVHLPIDTMRLAALSMKVNYDGKVPVLMVLVYCRITSYWCPVYRGHQQFSIHRRV